MPDWTPLVREKLESAQLPLEEKEQIIAEVTAHLEDLYEQYRMEGLNEFEAEKRVLSHLIDWRGFARDIQRARRPEGVVNSRVKNLWMPGLGSIVTAQLLPKLLLIVFMRLGVSFSVLGVRGSFIVALAVMALSGALGAFLSLLSGGDSRDRLASALFPVIVLVVAALVPGPGPGPYWLLLWAPSLVPLLWRTPVLALVESFTVLVYAGALFFGALPFLGLGSHLRQRTLG